MDSDKKCILIIDDEASFLDLLENKLSSYDAKIVRAMDGKEALYKIDNQKFDLIITDLKMPKMDGISFLEGKKINHLNSKTPVLILSGFLDEEKIKSLAPFKPCGVLAKPIDQEKFDGVMKKYFEGSQ